MAQKPWIVPIPGTTKIDRLKENLEAGSITITEEELQKMNQELGKIKITGARYNAQQESLVEKE